MQQRPATIIVFGVLNIIFGGLGVITVISNFIIMQFGVFEKLGLPQDPLTKRLLDLQKNDPLFSTVSTVSNLLGLLASAALLAAGIALLRMRPWGRVVSLIHAAYSMVSVIVITLFYYSRLYAPMLEEAKPNTQEKMQAVMGTVAGFGGCCLGMIYPICIFVFLTRPSLIAALKGESPEDDLPAPFDPRP